jgi:hypothetical protein
VTQNITRETIGLLYGVYIKAICCGRQNDDVVFTVVLKYIIDFYVASVLIDYCMQK